MNAKTEELVRKCFCQKHLEDCIFQAVCSDCFMRKESSRIASAARRFVRLENERKAKERHDKFLRWCRKHPNIDEKGVKLPKHWGQLKVNGKWI